jgi:hypothetical protein
MRNRVLTTATISQGAALSSDIVLDSYELVAVIMPAEWTAANLTVQVVHAGREVNVYDDAGTEVTLTAAANRMILLNTLTKQLRGQQTIRLRSGTSGTPVNQAFARTLTLVLRTAGG